MNIIIVLAIFTSALFHVGWNSLSRFSTCLDVAYFFTGFILVLIGSGGIIFLHSWHPSMLLIIIAMLDAAIESAYFLVLKLIARTSNLSIGYPFYRATSIILITCISFFNPHWKISLLQILVIVALTLLMITMVYQKNSNLTPQALSYLFLCATLIASYTLVGAYGVNLESNPLNYIVWMHLFQGIFMQIIAYYTLKKIKPLYHRHDIVIGILIGVFSFLAFGIVQWAQSKTQPALVSALREMGVVISLPVGKIVFNEKVTTKQYGIAIGIALCICALAII